MATDELQVAAVHNPLPSAPERQLTSPNSNYKEKKQRSEEMAHRQGQQTHGTITHSK